MAQESPPESKRETAPQQSSAQPAQRLMSTPLTPLEDGPPPLAVKKVQPEYPPQARDSLIEGQVVLKITISLEGDVNKADLISGDPMLAVAAIDAVRQWKYQPFLRNGQPAERETEVVVKFRLQPPAGHIGEAPTGPPGRQGGGLIGEITSAERVRVSALVSSGLVIQRVHPRYPPEARKARIQGLVLMHAVISTSGDITSLELVSGHPMLAPAAIEAVKQ